MNTQTRRSYAPSTFCDTPASACRDHVASPIGYASREENGPFWLSARQSRMAAHHIVAPLVHLLSLPPSFLPLWMALASMTMGFLYCLLPTNKDGSHEHNSSTGFQWLPTTWFHRVTSCRVIPASSQALPCSPQLPFPPPRLFLFSPSLLTLATHCCIPTHV